MRESEKASARLFASFLFPTLRWRERARRRTVEGGTGCGCIRSRRMDSMVVCGRCGCSVLVSIVCVKTDVLFG